MAKPRPTKFTSANGLRLLLALAAFLLLAEVFVHRHAYFALEALPLFFAAFGFLAFLVLIAVSWLVAKWVTRSADYYDTPKGDA
jgi:glucan phosphoethanolaminetransferase (alkaline phosphatase superfamily)